MKRILFLVALLMAIPASAQLLRHNFDEEGDTFIQGIVRGQFWARLTETNPGTTVQGEPADKVFDLSVRRYRLGFFAQVEKKWLFYISTKVPSKAPISVCLTCSVSILLAKN